MDAVIVDTLREARKALDDLLANKATLQAIGEAGRLSPRHLPATGGSIAAAMAARCATPCISPRNYPAASDRTGGPWRPPRSAMPGT
jgi:hypothetical protein